MPLTLRIYKILLDSQNKPIPPDSIPLNGNPVSGTPFDEVSYERGTQGNDGQRSFDYMYLGTGLLTNSQTFAPNPKGKMFFVAASGGKLVDLQVFPAHIAVGNNLQPPPEVLDGFEVFNPNYGSWEKAFVLNPETGEYEPNPVIISKEGVVFDARNSTLIFPFKVRLIVSPTDPSGRHEFFITIRGFEIE